MRIQRLMQILLVIILFLIFTFFLFNFLMKAVVSQKKDVMVPDLVGRTVFEAFDILSNNDLLFKKTGEQFHEQIPEGCIISQQPLPGSIVKAQKVIRVVISTGGQVVFVPNLINTSLRQAKITLRQSDLLMGEVKHIYSDTVAFDDIIAQNPPPDELVSKETTVNLVVSLGPSSETLPTMPDLSGRNINTVSTMLKKLNIGIGVVNTILDDTVSEGTILSQDPLPQQIIRKGQVVNLTVSRRSKSEQIIRSRIIHYEVPQGLLEKTIKVVVIDDQGERVLFEKNQSPGTKIAVPAQVLGRARARIYVNEIQVKEFSID